MPDVLEETPEWSRFVDTVYATTLEPDAILAAYRELGGRAAKSKARRELEEGIFSANKNGNGSRAQVLSNVRDTLRTPKPGVTGVRLQRKAEEYVEATAAVQLAFALMATEVPRDVVPLLEPDWYEKLPTDTRAAAVYRAWLLDPHGGPEPHVAQLDKKAAKISVGKAPGNAGRPLYSRIAASRSA